MKILWLVSITLPAAAAACGLPAAEVSGGWLTGQLDALCALPNAPGLTICSIDARVSACQTGGQAGESLRFAILPAATPDAFTALLQAEHPDLVHIWGTEYTAARVLQQAARAQGLPVLVGIQGVMRDCAAHLCDGVPAPYLKSCALQRLIDKVIPGALLDQSQANFDALAKSEAALLAEARHVTGRTPHYDRVAAGALAPHAHYWFCNETLRPLFYAAPRWAPHAFAAAPTLLLCQGNYPLKNLHTVLQALPAILRQYPGARLEIAGWPPLEKGPLLRPIIDWMFPYQRYCKRLVRELGLASHLHYTGPLQAEAMRDAFLRADVLLLPSSCENSPNGLGEAMLLGVPCVASRMGGIPDLLESGREGLLYGPAGDAAALAGAVREILALPDHGAALGQAARRRACATHDAAANANALLGIYQAILAGAGEDAE